MLSIYKASAGSGKTFTLAYEYIKMLLGRKDAVTGKYSLVVSPNSAHRHILAVTFSNKATDEMKKRIIHELALLGGLEPGWDGESAYMDKLVAELSTTPDKVRQAAGVALRQLLFDFNFFQVSTIDSFFQIILRTFAREADLAGNYELDLENETAVNHGVRQLFDSLAYNNAPRTNSLINWITQFLLVRLKDGNQISLFNRSSKVYADFVKFIKSITNDIFAQNYEAMMSYLSDHKRLQDFTAALSEREKSTKELTAQLCHRALGVIQSRGYDNGDVALKDTVIKKLASVADAGEDPSAKPSTIDKVAADVTESFKKKLAAMMAELPDDELYTAISEAAVAIVSSRSELKMLRTTRSNLYVLGLLERICHYVDEYRAESNTFLLSDTNNLLRTIIGDDDAPFVYERVGVRINHYLIDEFQDTSTLQWECLRPLLNEGQSKGHDSLIIGDEKQCIYRFRFSDPTLLRSRVGTEFAGMTSVKGDDPTENTNWRSSAHVVQYNNNLFDQLSQTLHFGNLYSNVRQQVSKGHADHHGYVSVAEISGENAEDTDQLSLERMYDNICRQLDAGYRPSDIAILVRFNSEGSKVIAYLMNRFAADDAHRDIRIVSDDAMYLNSAPVVNLIVSIMRFMAMPRVQADNDDQQQSKKRKVQMRDIRDLIIWYQHILSHDVDTEVALSDAIEKIHSRTAPAHVTDSMGQMANFNLPLLVEHIISTFVSHEVALKQNMYITALVDAVTDFCSHGPADLTEFLRWWDEQGVRSRISAPFDSQAIRVMTIHKSKGLEFRCVHIPFASWKFVDFKSNEWFATHHDFYGIDPAIVPPMLPYLPGEYMVGTPYEQQYRQRVAEQSLDELNVAYVAFTRAVDELIVSYTSGTGNSITLGALLNMVHAGDYTYGDPTTASEQKIKPKTALDPHRANDMALYKSIQRDDLWNSITVDTQLTYSKARDRGIVLHDVLAKVTHAGTLHAAIDLVTYQGRLPESERPEIAQYLSSQLERSEIAPWFKDYKRVLCERPLATQSGKSLRPDRVVWLNDGTVVVVDYKFGAEHPKKYATQVREYVETLRAMGYPNVTGRIWYVDSGIIRNVD